MKLELDPETEKWAKTPEWLKPKRDDLIAVRFEQIVLFDEDWVRLAIKNGIISRKADIVRPQSL